MIHNKGMSVVFFSRNKKPNEKVINLLISKGSRLEYANIIWTGTLAIHGQVVSSSLIEYDHDDTQTTTTVVESTGYLELAADTELTHLVIRGNVTVNEPYSLNIKGSLIIDGGTLRANNISYNSIEIINKGMLSCSNINNEAVKLAALQAPVEN